MGVVCKHELLQRKNTITEKSARSLASIHTVSVTLPCIKQEAHTSSAQAKRGPFFSCFLYLSEIKSGQRLTFMSISMIVFTV